MSFLNPSLSGQSVFNLPIIFTATYSSPSTILLNGGGVLSGFSSTQFASYNAVNGVVDILQTGKYRVSMVAYAKCNMAHTTGFGNFSFVAGSTILYTIQKNYTANTFASNTLPLWFWYNRSTSTLDRTSPVAAANAGYNFEGTIIHSSELILNRNDTVYLNCTLTAGTFTGAFDGYIQVEQLA
jgi:hypothetical protein